MPILLRLFQLMKNKKIAQGLDEHRENLICLL